MSARPDEPSPAARAALAVTAAAAPADLEAFVGRFSHRNNAPAARLLEAVAESAEQQPLLRRFPKAWYRGIHATLTGTCGETPAAAAALITATLNFLAAAHRRTPDPRAARTLAIAAQRKAGHP